MSGMQTWRVGCSWNGMILVGQCWLYRLALMQALRGRLHEGPIGEPRFDARHLPGSGTVTLLSNEVALVRTHSCT